MLNKILNFLNLNDDSDEDYDEDFYEDYEYNEPAPKKVIHDNGSQGKRSSTSRDTQTSSVDTARRDRKERYDRYNNGKVIPMKTSKTSDLSVHKPTQYDDAGDICNELLKGSPVVVNLEGIESGEAQRIMDFVCGCIHAIDGSLSQVSSYIFIFAPAGVDIHGDILVDTDKVPKIDKNV